jgi:hypothetical protein
MPSSAKTGSAGIAKAARIRAHKNFLSFIKFLKTNFRESFLDRFTGHLDAQLNGRKL